MREDDPMFYKVRMQNLIRQAKKNGIKVDYCLSEGPKGRTMKVLFTEENTGNTVAATVTERRYR